MGFLGCLKILFSSLKDHGFIRVYKFSLIDCKDIIGLLFSAAFNAGSKQSYFCGFSYFEGCK
jgi:hypothetical protein